MIGSLSVTLVMPCRNERSHLREVVAAVPDCFDEIVLVSNASTDGTLEEGLRLAESHPRLRVIRDDRTYKGIGYGYAIMSGMEAANGDVVVCTDCDGTYPIGDALRVLRQMLARGCAFATCSRYPDPSIPIMLRLGVCTLNIEIALLYGLRLNDSLSGMWVLLSDAIPFLRLTEGDWNLSPQIKINAFKYLGDLACELPIQQATERLGITKQNYLRTGLSHLLWIACNRVYEREFVQTPV